ncbi:cytochrome P450 [Aspergillus ambiguus]|uniref:cytochrome P450 n=1 Tax=Aspergillus ambiguus TaxID=176160 RepID=UPI003CCD64D8
MDTQMLWYALSWIIVYLSIKTIYRLYFHPLSKIPGPRLTAATHLYEFYYDVILGGKFLFQIEKMHQTYGPIVRINPREVHINDPTFYDDIYASSTVKRDKDPQFVTTFGLPLSMVSTVGHEHHRFRRNILNSFFSKRSVLELSPLIEERVQKLMERFEGFHSSGSVVRMDDAFAALTSDVITAYSYGKSWLFLEDEAFRSDIRKAVADITSIFHLNRFFPLLTRVMRMVPLEVMALLQPGKTSLLKFQEDIFKQSADSLVTENTASQRKMSAVRRNIYDKLTDNSLPSAERTLQRIQDEGIVLLAAGTETTGRALTIASFYLGRNRDMVKRLREELRTVMPRPTDMVSWTALEKLPYLTGVVYESLRLSYGLTIRLPRVSPKDALKYDEYVIPPGTPMSSCTYLIHRNETIFPDAESFEPERWVRATEEGKNLTRYIASFTRGSRACLGMNLAYMELYLTLASFARRFDFELHNTTVEDMRITSDVGIGFTRRGDLQVYAKVTGIVKD